jgi:site-specific recombinase XerD
LAARRTQGDGTLFRRGDGYWVGGVELPPGADGRRRYRRVVRKNRNSAIEALRGLRRDVEAGKLATSGSATVAAWLDYWSAKILPNKDLKASTLYSYRSTIKTLKPLLGRKRLARLTPADIRRAYEFIESNNGPRSAQKCDQTLRLAVKAAVREGIMASNVMDRVDKPSYRAREAASFDGATAAHIIATAYEVQGEMWAARWATGFLTGARESEVLGLEWDRVDLDQASVDISWQLKREHKRHGCGDPVGERWPCGKVRQSFCPDAEWDFPKSLEWRPCTGTLVWTRPKTKAGKRLIPLVPALVEILRGLRGEEVFSPNRHGLVFHHPDGRPISTEDDQQAWRELLQAAGLPHAKQHSIRHSTATLLLEAGVDTHVVQTVIGHSSAITTRSYQHVGLGLAREAWANLAQIMPKVEK